MDNIIPFILQSLSTKPLSSETGKNLMKEVRLRLKNENLKSSNLKKDFDEAIEIGEDLGIFRLAGENISLPFSLENKKTQPEPKSSRNKSVPATMSKTSKLAITDKERRSSRRRGRRASGGRHSRSRSRSGSRSHSHSQRRRRSSRI